MGTALSAAFYACELGDHRALRAFVPLVGEGGAVGPMHVCMEGEWMGHPAGPFKITSDDIDQMIGMFDPQKNPMMVDYGHRSLNETGTPDDLKAAGWIQHLEKRQGKDGAELWATVEWTPPAAAAIKAGEFRYCSPVIDYAPVDRKTGAEGGVELFNVAITNQPFLDGQHPIRLTRVAAAFEPKPKKQPPPDPNAKADPKAPPDKQQAAPPDNEQDPPPNSPADAKEDASDPADKGEQDAQKPNDQQAAGDNAPPQEQQPAEPPPPPATPQQNVQDAELMSALDALKQASGLDQAALVSLLKDYADSIGSSLAAKAERDGTPAEQRNIHMTDKKTDAKPAGESQATDEQRLAELENKRKDDLIVALSARLEKVEEAEKVRSDKQAEDHKRMIASHVEKLIQSGHVRETGRDEAVWAFTANWERAEKIYAEPVVPIKRTQAGNDPVFELTAKKVDPKTATEDDLLPYEREVFVSLMRTGRRTKEAAMGIVLSQRVELHRVAKANGLVH